MSFIKEKLDLMFRHLRVIVRQSTRGQRITALAPFVAAAVFSGLTIVLNIFLRDVSTDQAVVNFFTSFSILAVFFAGITWITPMLVSRHLSRYQERRAVDVLWLGLYIPQVIAAMVIFYSQLSGSENITDLSAAIITWAMLSLILTPFSVILTFVIWSFLPKELPDMPRLGKVALPSLVKLPKLPPLEAEILEPITELPQNKQTVLAKNENEKPMAVDMGSRLNRVGQTRR